MHIEPILNILTIYWTHTDHIWNIYWTHMDHVLNTYGTYIEYILNTYWIPIERISNKYWICIEHACRHIGYMLNYTLYILKAGHNICTNIKSCTNTKSAFGIRPTIRYNWSYNWSPSRTYSQSTTKIFSLIFPSRLNAFSMVMDAADFGFPNRWLSDIPGGSFLSTSLNIFETAVRAYL